MEVKVKAIKAAKEMAESLSSALNQTISRAIYIQEVANPYYLDSALQGRLAGTNDRYKAEANDASAAQIESEMVNLLNSIVLRFGLK